MIICRRLLIDRQAWCGLTLMLVGNLGFTQTTPNNGSFENGLTDWTLAGIMRAESLASANFNPAIDATDGSRVGFLSNGPGNAPGGGAQQLDGNAVNDFDASMLRTNLSFNLFPAMLRFDWNFFSTEQNQAAFFDDFFAVLIDDNIVFGRSAAKAVPGVSPLADAPAGPAGAQMVNSPGVTDGTFSNFQFAGWQSECIGIANAMPGQNDFQLDLLVADQGDAGFDTGVAFDNIRVDSACGDPGDVTLTQVTNSSTTQVEQKDGTFIARPAVNRAVVADADGSTIGFIAQGDFAGNNPSFLEQVFVFENGLLQRSTVLTGDEVQNMDISPNGRWIVFAARQNAADNLEIFRLDNNNGNLLTITTTTDCDNTNPTVNANGRRIGFLSTCGNEIAAGFNADGNREVVIWNNGSFVPLETTGCSSFRPATRTNNNGQHIAFASDCDLIGDNADGNIEIYRLNRTNMTIDQITDTTGVTNLDSVDINNAGNLVAYISTDIAGNRVIQLWDANTGSAQLIGNSTLNPVIALNMQPVATPTAISFERLDIFTGEVIAAQVDINSQVITEVARGLSISGTAASVNAGVPIVHIAAGDDLIGLNSDVNPEIFSGRVE